MERTFQLKSRIISRAYEYLTNKQFLDCKLTDGDHEYLAHRIILSQQSKWFYNFFNRNPTLDPIQTVALPFNSEEVIKNILPFIYSETLHLSPNNIVVILKAAEVYGIDKLLMIARSYLADIFTESSNNNFRDKENESYFKGKPKNKSNEKSNSNNNESLSSLKISDIPGFHIALSLSKQLVECGLDDEVFEFKNIFAKYLLIASPQQKNEIYCSISPKILASILKSNRFAAISESGKISMIDDFVSHRPEKASSLTKEDKENLESVIDWTKDKAYIYFVRHSCDWVTEFTARPFLGKILDIRRKNIKSFSEESQTALSSSSSTTAVGRWYPFIWAHSIADAQLVSQSPKVNIVSFANTLGILSKPINPGKYGLLLLNSTKEFNKLNTVNNAVSLDDNTYYLSQDMSFDPLSRPFMSVCFSPNSHFVPSKVSIRSDLPRRNGAKRQFPTSVVLGGNTGAGQMAEPLVGKIVFKEGTAECKLETSIAFAALKITMNEEESNGGWILRVRFIDFEGCFLP